jgi:nitrogen-specific signal transduction histidine kinase
MELGEDSESGLSDSELRLEYSALLQFLHLAPIGLVRARFSGEIVLMNPMASQLLSTIGMHDVEFNIFDIFDKVSKDVRMLVQEFHNSKDVILCEDFQLLLPENKAAKDAPIALGVTIMRLPADPDTLMVVITDASGAWRLKRLQAAWIR